MEVVLVIEGHLVGERARALECIHRTLPRFPAEMRVVRRLGGHDAFDEIISLQGDLIARDRQIAQR